MRRLSEQQEKEIQDVLTLKPNSKLLTYYQAQLVEKKKIYDLKRRHPKPLSKDNIVVMWMPKKLLLFLFNAMVENPDNGPYPQ